MEQGLFVEVVMDLLSKEENPLGRFALG